MTGVVAGRGRSSSSSQGPGTQLGPWLAPPLTTTTRAFSLPHTCCYIYTLPHQVLLGFATHTRQHHKTLLTEIHNIVIKMPDAVEQKDMKHQKQLNPAKHKVLSGVKRLKSGRPLLMSWTFQGLHQSCIASIHLSTLVPQYTWLGCVAVCSGRETRGGGCWEVTVSVAER